MNMLSIFRYGYNIVFLLILCALYGCTYFPERTENVIPVAEVQYVELTLIEGKTTKQEVMDALGMPDDFSTDSLSYKYDDNIQAKLYIVCKDGTKMNTILGSGHKCSTLLIQFGGEYDKNGNSIPSNKNTGFSLL